ncbi:MAG: glycosyltransferase, partial [Gemmatimonadaceae bacterium]
MLSVVVATYNRRASAERLLGELARQSLAPAEFEVIVVDDGSAEPVAPALRAVPTPFALRVLEQPNAGPAAARHRGILAAEGDVVVIVDDDMRLPPDFLAAHRAAHPAGSRRVVLGLIEADAGDRLPLHERYTTALIERTVRGAARGTSRLVGTNLYTGNVSFRRADYLRVGGFDPSFRISEDAELGVRLEQAGVEFVGSVDARAAHASDHASFAGFVRRAERYGVADSRMAEKHPALPDADPWRYLWVVHPLARPLLVLGAFAPWAARPVAALVLALARLLDAVGMERRALVLVGLTHGMHYFRGVGRRAAETGGRLRAARRYVAAVDGERLGGVGRLLKVWADLERDFEALRRADAKYRGQGGESPSRRLAFAVVQRIGLQMLAAYRLMRFFRTSGLGLLAKLTSRMMRHLYGADLHWDAALAPGVIIVHGVGLVIAPGVRVGPGCVLFQHVTLGQSIHPDSREVGVPTLEADVHVGPGATLLGPITVGADSKVMGGVVLMRSVPPGSLVESPAPAVRPRRAPAAPAPAASAPEEEPAPED